MKDHGEFIKDSVEECIPRINPLERPWYTVAEVQALRAVQGGTADARQQRLFFDYCIRAFGTHDLSFRPDNSHLTDFCEGKRFAGDTLIWMLRTAPTRTDPDKIAVRSAGEQHE